MIITKQAASKDASDHLERARTALYVVHRDGLNDDGVLRNPHVQASHLRIAREEINKALAIIEQTRWRGIEGFGSRQPHNPRARPSEKAPDRQIGRPTPNASKVGKPEAKGASRLALGRRDTPKKNPPISAKSVRAMVRSQGKRRARTR